jgi:hypothetical protein
MPLGVQKFKIGCCHVIEVMGVGHRLTFMYIYIYKTLKEDCYCRHL